MTDLLSPAICLLSLVFTAASFGTGKITINNLSAAPLEEVTVLLPLSQISKQIGIVEPHQQLSIRMSVSSDDSPKLLLVFKGRPIEKGLGYMSATSTLKTTVTLEESGEITSVETYY